MACFVLIRVEQKELERPMEIDYLKSMGIGGGFDTVELVNSLVNAERAPTQASIDRRASDVEVRISGTAQLKSALQALQTSFAVLDDAREFNFLDVRNPATSALTATVTGSSAVAGAHSLQITQIAQRSTFVSDAQASRDTDLNSGAAATFTFTVGDGDAQTVSLDAGDATLDNLAAGINALSAGVRARVVEVESGSYRLFVESENTGTDSEIAISADLFNISANEALAAQDATLTYNGVSVTRSSNQVTDLIPGVTLDLMATTDASFLLEITQDNTQAKEAITGLVDAYNTFEDVMKTLTAVATEDSEGGAFASDPLVRDIQTRMKNLFFSEGSTAGDNISRMNDLGIMFDRYGKLQVNELALSTALNDHYSEIKQFFTAGTDDQSIYGVASRGFAGDLLKQINDLLKYDGTLTRMDLTNTKTVAGLVAEEKKLDDKMELVKQRYTSKFTSMNAAIAEMNSLKEYLDGQLKNLPFTSQNN